MAVLCGQQFNFRTYQLVLPLNRYFKSLIGFIGQWPQSARPSRPHAYLVWAIPFYVLGIYDFKRGSRRLRSRREDRQALNQKLNGRMNPATRLRHRTGYRRRNRAAGAIDGDASDDTPPRCFNRAADRARSG